MMAASMAVFSVRMAGWGCLFVEDERGGAYVHDVALVEEHLLLQAEDVALVERARATRGVAQGEEQFALAALYAHDAVGSVDARVNGLEGGVRGRTLHAAPDDVVALAEGYLLPQLEGVFEHHEMGGDFLRSFVRRGGLNFWRGNTQAEALAA